MLTISGIFKERSVDPNAEHVRAFQRTLMIAPKDRSVEESGLCIVNDMLHVNNATIEQSRKAFRTLLTISSAYKKMTPEQQKIEILVEELMLHSGMNSEWSRKCLNETNWDYARALYVFKMLNRQEQIPQEAFVENEAMQE
jgi:nuclear RNA export factor